MTVKSTKVKTKKPAKVPRGIERDPDRPGRWLVRFTDGTTKAVGRTRTMNGADTREGQR
jgi:hypothetical protein